MITKIIAGFQYVSRSYIPSSPHPVYPAIVEFIFYGNYFYGICVVALSIEATVQQFFPLNNSVYYFFVCCITVLYYDYPYVRRYKSAGDNSRTAWYIKNYNLVRWNQIIITAILLSAFVVLTYWYRSNIQHMGLVNWVLLLIFPAGASLYYGINFLSRRYNLRSIGWLKPFIIGFSWAGLVTIYPILYYAIVNNQDYQPTVIGLLLFLKNFMYIALLAIMLDVKDYVTDYASKLKTFVVKIGLRKTILFILLPPAGCWSVYIHMLCRAPPVPLHEDFIEHNPFHPAPGGRKLVTQTAQPHVLPGGDRWPHAYKSHLRDYRDAIVLNVSHVYQVEVNRKGHHGKNDRNNDRKRGTHKYNSLVILGMIQTQ